MVEKKRALAAPTRRCASRSCASTTRCRPEAGAHPAACDWVEYLRFRNARGPKEARDADAVMVMIPGFLGGAGSFDQLARNTVRRAAQRGRTSSSGRSTGARTASRTTPASGPRRARATPTIACDYYWGGKPVDGKTFAGFVSPQDAEFLGEFGLERTVRDWYTVLRTGIPGQPRRARKVICGGHSLGGPLTAAFASWDFDGDPATTADAGYKQCAGLVGLDTTLSLGGGGGRRRRVGGLGDVVGGARPTSTRRR